MESAGRLSNWWRRRSGTDADPAGPADADQRASRLAELLAAARAGFPVVPAAHAVDYRCSCDRMGCPAPAQHPLSFAWQSMATVDAEQVTRWLARDPQANAVTATGRAHDVLDVPAEAGRLALQRMGELGIPVGPVAAVGEDRFLFFTTTRSTLDEDEWWTSELDTHPEDLAEHPGIRWHTRGSYVLLPPSRLTDGSAVTWVRPPELPLPDPLRVLDLLADACTAVGAAAAGERWFIG
ncbi:bifunctional DNA primase/polymerase [Streptacidiphilus sp. PB12-B1b]|uniref:bifunctional DNA primase/polymerase n=1 Tax=Streptacidiphilus sp. PB12-B1b TaxID=2705012 RepID=UPI0015FB0BEF|nr:bifunctional DNA primase/polymerase [Streptacidiphilus sp. PB12-B1b]QMU75774.1 bifunctional DNA primase/polymerase [Streptacidiphilus sp. PB12-B1b]